jgi:hypothetical protein
VGGLDGVGVVVPVEVGTSGLSALQLPSWFAENVGLGTSKGVKTASSIQPLAPSGGRRSPGVEGVEAVEVGLGLEPGLEVAGFGGLEPRGSEQTFNLTQLP